MADAQPLLVFYDIASAPPVTTFAPNPWKSRYALNFKRVNYRTEWVDLPDVTSVRKSLGAEPVRFFEDGEAFYTLPVLKDDSTNDVVGDSFDIALHLDKAYPSEHTLFPASTVGLQKVFNAYVDSVFTAGVILFLQGLPFNPATAEASKAEFCRRAGAASWDDLTVSGEARTKALESLRKSLEGLARAYERAGGPFLEGGTPTYADFVVGGWLMMAKVCLPAAEWEDMHSSWQGGLWGRLHDALEPYRQVK